MGKDIGRGATAPGGGTAANGTGTWDGAARVAEHETEHGGGKSARGAGSSARDDGGDPRSAEEIARDRAIDTGGYGIMTKKELCYKYFPGSASPPAARKMLNRTVQRCPKLVAALRDTGYRKTSRELTPRQVALFYYYIGEP